MGKPVFDHAICVDFRVRAVGRRLWYRSVIKPQDSRQGSDYDVAVTSDDDVDGYRRPFLEIIVAKISVEAISITILFFVD